ncbi:MAG: hypothetical protein RJA25_237 [Bacteroidota bacterium]
MHKNNFDFLRLLFASMVVVHHCYPIAGISEQDPLYYFSNGTLSYSYIGVRGFFVISGYLIFQSLIRSENITDYMVKRLLRIYPALLVVLAATIIACSFVYNGTFFQYFQNKSTWTYIPINASLFKLQYAIKGVFEQNPYKNAINGSLWTIGYEFSMYVFIIPLFALKRHSKSVKTIIVSAMVVLFFIIRILVQGKTNLPHIGLLSLDQWCHFGLLFMSGALLSVIQIEQYSKRTWIFGACIILFFALMRWPYYEFAQYFIFPPIIIIAGIAATKGIADIGKIFGDISYGTYIYGFPIQQLLMYYFHFNVVELLLVSVPMTLLCGWLSWHYVEKHALAKKKIVYHKLKNIFPI